MPKVVSFINYKGGVGKTTSAYHVACSLAQHHNQKVLMIDIDPQTNLTFLCAQIAQWERRKRNTGTIANLYKRYVDRQPLDVNRYIWNDPVVIGRHAISGLDLIPCDIDLLGEDVGGGQIAGSFPALQALQQDARRYVRDLSFLKRVVEETDEKYDWVIIDCPPNLYLMTQNALYASDYYLVTAVPDHLSTLGLNTLIRKIDDIGNRMAAVSTLAGENAKGTVAELAGIVFVKVRMGGSMITTTHASRMETATLQSWGAGKVFVTHTTEYIGYSEAAESSVPVWEHGSQNARRAAQANEYPRITLELINRLSQKP